MLRKNSWRKSVILNIKREIENTQSSFFQNNYIEQLGSITHLSSANRNIRDAFSFIKPSSWSKEFLKLPISYIECRHVEKLITEAIFQFIYLGRFPTENLRKIELCVLNHRKIHLSLFVQIFDSYFPRRPLSANVGIAVWYSRWVIVVHVRKRVAVLFFRYGKRRRRYGFSIELNIQSNIGCWQQEVKYLDVIMDARFSWGVM